MFDLDAHPESRIRKIAPSLTARPRIGSITIEGFDRIQT
jgi:hypothetical protein